jgi:hypothetical protein
MNFSELSVKYDWITWDSIPNADYLALVIRRLRSEYVVHLYNNESGSHYYGDYFKNFEDAEKCYADRLAKYEHKI